MCNIEFPHFGASYPDAHCIDGYLWDMDSYENGCYTIGGDDPCPFCNTDAWLKTVLDNEEFASREEALEWVKIMREKWGAEHSGSSEIPNDLEEAADNHIRKVVDAAGHPGWDWTTQDIRNAFIAGYKLHEANAPLPEDTVLFNKGVEEGKRLMREEAAEGTVTCHNLNRYILVPGLDESLTYGDRVRVIVLKKEDKK